MILAKFAATASNVFTPLEVNPTAWWDASNSASITHVGGSVSQWDDLSGNGYHLTQGTGVYQPVTNSSTLNGLNVLEFVNANMGNTPASNWTFLHNGTTTLLMMVAKENVSAGGFAWYFNTATSTSTVGYIFAMDDGTPNKALFNFVARGSSPAPVNNTTGNNVVVADTFSIMQVLADPDNGTAADRSEIFVDNGSAIKNNTSTSTPSASNPTNGLAIGRASNVSAGNINGAIAEIIVVQGADATDANRQILLDYLQAKWGL
jgi:hypothetical protein